MPNFENLAYLCFLNHFEQHYIMQNKSILILFLLFSLTTSCQKDFLDEEVFTFQAPKDYYSNENEVKAAANGMYDALMTWELWVQPSWIPIALENDDMFAQDWVAGGLCRGTKRAVVH